MARLSLGVGMWKDSRKKHTFGYGVRPVFQIALGFPDSLYLEHFHKVTGWGQICPNRKSGHYWVVRDHDELSELLELLKRHVRFPSTLKKIALHRISIYYARQTTLHNGHLEEGAGDYC